MRVVIASAPHADTFGYSMPPPGLLRLAGAVRAAEPGAASDVALEDLAYRLAAGDLPSGDGLCAAAAELLLARAPDLLGLSTMGATLPAALAIAARVRAERPATRIVLGGPGATGIDAALLARFDAVDAVVRGEGEETLPALLARYANERTPEGVAGVTWRDARGDVHREPDRAALADLGALPAYAYDLLPPIAAYKALTGEDEGLVPLDSGRGCVFDCSFCTIGRFWSRRSRPLPVPRLVDEIAALRSIDGARRAYLCHDLFAADRKHALALCDALEAADLGVPWEVRARVDHLDDELIERMGAAGCYRVLLGVESGDAAVREAHQKKMRTDVDVVHVVETLGRNGITPILSLILGLPGEDDDALEATLALAEACSLAAGCNLSLHLVNPQPGCGLGDEFGAESAPVDGIPPDMALGAGETAEERALIAAHPDLFSTFALLSGRPGGVARLRALHALNAELPDVLMARPRTFALARARLGLSVRGLFERWKASPEGTGSGAAGFDALAAGLGDPAVDDLLAWERAIEAAPGRPLGEPALVRARFDLPRLASDLRAARGGAEQVVKPVETTLAVVRGMGGVRTLRVSADVARLIETPDADRTPEVRALLCSRGLAPTDDATTTELATP